MSAAQGSLPVLSGDAESALVSEVQTDHDDLAAVRARPWVPLARDEWWSPA
jgi:hypothetical protein